MASKPRANNRDFTELGVSGVQVFNGIISGEEYNQNLVGRRALAIWDEMRRSDASVKMTLKAINEPVKALTWFMTAASDDDKDVEVAQFIERNIKDILRWKTVLGEILTYLPFGYSVFEKVLGYQVLDGYERIVLERLAFRKQRSIAKWEAGKGIAGVTQYGAGGSLIPIPLERIVVFTNEQEVTTTKGRATFELLTSTGSTRTSSIKLMRSEPNGRRLAWWTLPTR